MIALILLLALPATAQETGADEDPPRAFQGQESTRFPDYPERRQAMGSTTAVYRSYGIEDYLRGETRIHARPARGDEPRRLHQHPDMPVMVVRAVDTLLDGTPIAHSEVIWSAARVKFSINPNEDDA